MPERISALQALRVRDPEEDSDNLSALAKLRPRAVAPAPVAPALAPPPALPSQPVIDPEIARRDEEAAGFENQILPRSKDTRFRAALDALRASPSAMKRYGPRLRSARRGEIPRTPVINKIARIVDFEQRAESVNFRKSIHELFATNKNLTPERQTAAAEQFLDVLRTRPQDAPELIARARQEAMDRAGPRGISQYTLDALTQFSENIPRVLDAPAAALEKLGEASQQGHLRPGQQQPETRQLAQKGLGGLTGAARFAGKVANVPMYTLPGVGQARIGLEVAGLVARGAGAGEVGTESQKQSGIGGEALSLGIMLAGGKILSGAGSVLGKLGIPGREVLKKASPHVVKAIIAGHAGIEAKQTFEEALKTGTVTEAFVKALEGAMPTIVGLYASHKLGKIDRKWRSPREGQLRADVAARRELSPFSRHRGLGPKKFRAQEAEERKFRQATEKYTELIKHAEREAKEKRLDVKRAQAAPKLAALARSRLRRAGRSQRFQFDAETRRQINKIESKIYREREKALEKFRAEEVASGRGSSVSLKDAKAALAKQIRAEAVERVTGIKQPVDPEAPRHGPVQSADKKGKVTIAPSLRPEKLYKPRPIGKADIPAHKPRPVGEGDFLQHKPTPIGKIGKLPGEGEQAPKVTPPTKPKPLVLPKLGPAAPKAKTAKAPKLPKISAKTGKDELARRQADLVAAKKREGSLSVKDKPRTLDEAANAVRAAEKAVSVAKVAPQPKPQKPATPAAIAKIVAKGTQATQKDFHVLRRYADDSPDAAIRKSAKDAVAEIRGLQPDASVIAEIKSIRTKKTVGKADAQRLSEIATTGVTTQERDAALKLWKAVNKQITSKPGTSIPPTTGGGGVQKVFKPGISVIDSKKRLVPPERTLAQAAKSPPVKPVSGTQAKVDKLRTEINETIKKHSDKLTPDVIARLASKMTRYRTSSLDKMVPAELGRLKRRLARHLVKGGLELPKLPRTVKTANIDKLHAERNKLGVNEVEYLRMVREVSGGKTGDDGALTAKQGKMLIGRMRGAKGVEGGIGAPQDVQRPVSSAEVRKWESDIETASKEVTAKAGIRYPVKKGDASKLSLRQRIAGSKPYQMLGPQNEDPITRLQRISGEKSVASRIIDKDLRRSESRIFGRRQAILDGANAALAKSGGTLKDLERYYETNVKLKLPSGQTINRTMDEYQMLAIRSSDPHQRAELETRGIAPADGRWDMKLPGRDQNFLQAWVKANTKMGLPNWFARMARTEGGQIAREAVWQETGQVFKLEDSFIPHRHLGSAIQESKTLRQSPKALKKYYEDVAAGRKAPKGMLGYGERGSPQERRLSNMPLSKARTGSNAPIVIEGFLDVMERHITQLSAWREGSVPIQRAREVIWNKKFRRSVQQGFADGDATLRNLERHITAFEGLENSGSGTGEKFFGKAIGRLQKAFVGGKFHINAYQGASLLNASAVIPRKYLQKALLISDPNIRSEMKQYAPKLHARRVGTGRMMLSPSMSPSRKEVIFQAFGAKPKLSDRAAYGGIKYVDTAVIDKIFIAAKLEMKAKGYRGKQLLRKAGEQAEQAADLTQPTWSPLTISTNQLEGRTSPTIKYLSMFSAQSNTNTNMAIRSVDSWADGNRTTSAMLRDVVVPLVVNPAIVYVLGKSAFKLYGYERDETLLDHTLNLMERSMGGLIYVRDLQKAARKLLEGRKWAKQGGLDPTSAMEAAGDMLDVFRELLKDDRYIRRGSLGKKIKVKRKAAEALLSTLVATSRVFGLPLEGIPQALGPRLILPALGVKQSKSKGGRRTRRRTRR